MPASLSSPERELLLIVEDINRSGQAQILLEKIIGWSRAEGVEKSSGSNWRLICPIWPEALALLREQFRKLIEPLLIVAAGFSESEGCQAVLARARLDGRTLSTLSAEAISRALGNDPLLIALHDLDTDPVSGDVIGQFISSSLERTAGENREAAAVTYHAVLLALAREMLTRRQIELDWRKVNAWQDLQGEPLRLLGQIAHRGELIRIEGPLSEQRLLFRHDRVRDWLLVTAATELARQNALPELIVIDPYFAELIGEVLIQTEFNPSLLCKVAPVNPLAFFHVLRRLGPVAETCCPEIIQEIHRWLDDPATHGPCNNRLRSEAMAMLAKADSTKVPAIVRRFRVQTSDAQFARLRNGDLLGGIELCSDMEPGVGAPWRDAQIEHAKLRYGAALSTTLNGFLRRGDLEEFATIGAIRLAGHIGDPTLSLAIEVCWKSDVHRNSHLADYLWAYAECCGDEPARFLGPVCEAWAALSNVPEKEGSGLASRKLRGV